MIGGGPKRGTGDLDLQVQRGTKRLKITLDQGLLLRSTKNPRSIRRIKRVKRRRKRNTKKDMNKITLLTI